MATNLLPTTDEALDFAVETISRGDLDRGRKVLSWVLQQEPNNIVAWTWMTRCTNDMDALREVHRRIDALNPFV